MSHFTSGFTSPQVHLQVAKGPSATKYVNQFLGALIQEYLQ